MARKPLTEKEKYERYLIWKSFEPYVLGGFVIIAVLVVGGLLAREHFSSTKDAQKKNALATINGEALSPREFQQALNSQAGQAVLDKLILKKLVAQEAKKHEVTVESDELTLPPNLENSPNKDVLIGELRTALLMRKLILKTVTEADIKKVYDTFKPELTQYDIAIQADGMEEEKEVKNLSLRALELRFGTDRAASIIKMKEGEKSEPIPVANSKAVVRMLAVRSDFDSLREPAENVIVNARQTKYLHDLLERADIQSPFTEIGQDTAAPTPAATNAPEKG